MPVHTLTEQRKKKSKLKKVTKRLVSPFGKAKKSKVKKAIKSSKVKK